MTEITINTAKFNAVWDYLKIKVPVATFQQTYDNFERVFKVEVIKGMNLPAISELRVIFWFTGETVEQCRAQFVNWISKHKEFYHDNLFEMIRLMIARRDELNQQRNEAGVFPIQHINKFPEYGGKIQDKRLLQEYDKLIYTQADWKLPWVNPAYEAEVQAMQAAEKAIEDAKKEEKRQQKRLERELEREMRKREREMRKRERE